MTNNETIVNGNTADDNIIETPRLDIFDSLDDIEHLLEKNKQKNNQLNYLIGNDWVIYSWHNTLNPIIIRNGIEIIKWIWRNFNIVCPRGVHGKSLDIHNYIRLQCGLNVSLFEAAGDHMDVLDHSGYEMFIREALNSYLIDMIWIPNEDFVRSRDNRPIKFLKVPYFRSCFNYGTRFWVARHTPSFEAELVFYYIYLHFEYGARTAEQQIDMIKKVWGIYNEEK